MELLKTINDYKIPQIPWRNGSSVVEQEIPGGIVAGHLDGGDGVCPHVDGLFHNGVYVPPLQKVTGMDVVCTEHAPLSVLVAQQGEEGLQIPGGGALPDHDELPPLQLGDGVAEVVALVVGVDAGGDVGVEVVVHQVRGMAINFLVMGLGCYDLLQRLVISGDDAHEVHHLCQPLHPGVVVEGVQTPVVQYRAGLVQRRGRHTGGQHETHIHR